MWLRRWRRRLNKWSELAEADRRARRGGAKRRVEELTAVRDILYEDKWYRIATAVYAQVKRQFAEDEKAGELLKAAEKRLFGLRLEVVEVPLLKIEAAVDRDGRVAAVRCRASLDVGVEAVFEGVAPGYRLEKTAQAGKTANADAAEDIKSRGGVESAGAGAEAAEKAAGWGARRRG
jgi:hypothetical protein